MDINSIDTQKQLILRNEFAQINISHNQPVSLQDIQFALDQKLQGQTFDRIILQQLFEQMSFRNENQTTVDEFIKVYLNAEKILLQKIEQSKEYLQNYQRQARETKNKIQLVKTKEKVNDHGITEDSTFTFSVISAVLGNQFHSDNQLTYVQITCGNQERKTQSENSMYPQYNYSNSFVIETGDEEIRFSLIDGSNKQTIGMSMLNISDLKNQQVFDTELQLSNDYGHPVGSLKVQLRWIHSKVKYLEDVLNKWLEYAESQSQDLEDYQRDLLTLYEPFKQLQIYNRNQLNIQSQQQFPSNSNAFYEEQQQQQQLFAGATHAPSYKAAYQEQNQPTHDGGFNNLLLNTGQQMDYKRIAMLATIGYLCMVILVSFERSMFFDILVVFKYYDYHIKEEFTGLIYKYFTITIFISFVVFDLGWIINFTKIWFGGDYPDNGVKYFVDLLTILLFLYKLFLMITYLLNWHHYEQIQAQLRGSAHPSNPIQQGGVLGVDNLQQHMNLSNTPPYASNNSANNHFLNNLNNPQYNPQTIQYNQQQYPDTMKTTRNFILFNFENV